MIQEIVAASSHLPSRAIIERRPSFGYELVLANDADRVLRPQGCRLTSMSC